MSRSNSGQIVDAGLVLRLDDLAVLPSKRATGRPRMSLIDWLSQLPFILMVKTSSWLYPLVNGAHILAFAAGFGMILAVDLGLLGLLRYESREEVVAIFAPLAAGAFLIAMALGSVLFLTKPHEYLSNRAFLIKLALIATAVVNAAVLHAMRRQAKAVRAHEQAAALLSMALWAGVILSGRSIAF